MTRTLLLATAGTAALTLATGASAQNAAPTSPAVSASRTTVYQSSFFAQYAPRTALDIVQRVPGFSLDLGATQTQQGSVDVRGFAGTAGNVVINGARPSTKAETLDVTLSRIPAQQVIRVELGPGDLYGSDYAGKSQVLNVVLSQQARNRRRNYGRSETLVYRLCEHRHSRVGIDPKWSIDVQHCRRHGSKPAARGRR